MKNNLLESYLEELFLNEFIVMPTILLAAHLYNRHLSTAAKSCAKYKGKDKSKCMITYKIKGRKLQFDKLKQAGNECSKDPKPDKCKEMVLKKAKKTKEDLNKLIEKYKKLNA